MSKTFEDAIAALVAADPELAEAVNVRLSKVNSEAKGLRDRMHKTESRLTKILEVSGIDPETPDDELETVVKKTSKKSAEPDILKLQRQVDELTKRERNAIEKHQNSIKTSSIADELAKNKVIGDWIPTIRDVLHSKVKFTDDDKMVFTGEDGSEIDFSEGVKNYVSKNPRLISNDQNPGSGSSAPDAKGQSKTISKEDFSKLDPLAKHDFVVKEKGTII